MREFIIVAALVVAGFAYLFYLDRGCELGGVMTWQGKVCVENL